MPASNPSARKSLYPHWVRLFSNRNMPMDNIDKLEYGSGVSSASPGVIPNQTVVVKGMSNREFLGQYARAGKEWGAFRVALPLSTKQ